MKKNQKNQIAYYLNLLKTALEMQEITAMTWEDYGQDDIDKLEKLITKLERN